MNRGARRLFSAAAALLPSSWLHRWLSWSTRDLCIALCFHRVNRDRRASDPLPEQTVAPEVLDELLAFLATSMPAAPAQLFLCFDDGYADAARYVAARAARHPSIQWLFLVCPEKIEKRACFRWDLFESTANRGEVALDAFLETNLSVDFENQRPELRELAQRETFALATVEACAQLGSMRNVSLGNHTNCHFRLSRLPREEAEHELKSSMADFERLWGTCRHLAFPFGTPKEDFTSDHVEMINKMGPALLWSTEQRPFRPAEVIPGAVLPRLTVYQFANPKAMVTKICLLATLFRCRSQSQATPATDVPSAPGLPPVKPGNC